MKIQNLIEELQKLQSQHEDIDVVINTANGERAINSVVYAPAKTAATKSDTAQAFGEHLFQGERVAISS